jgi:hypothetical protein
MAAHFSRRRALFGWSPGHFDEPATARVAEEEKQGTMIVPSDPCGRSSPVTAGVAALHSGSAG